MEKVRDILQQKSYRTYDYLSRYSNFPYYYNTLDKKYVYGTTTQLHTDTPFVLYKVIPGDTYDSIALEFYNTPLYYWMICDFNQIQDPLDPPIPGTRLKVPTLSSITYKDN